MIELWMLIIVLLVLALIILFLPLIRPRNETTKLSDKQQNITIFKDRLEELEQEKIIGNLDEVSFSHLKTELEKSLLTDVDSKQGITLEPVIITKKYWQIVSIIALCMVCTSLGIYFTLGESAGYSKYLTMKENGELESQKADNAMESFDKIITMLKAKLKQDPKDIDKWFLLANTYSAIGKFDEAGAAYLSAEKQMSAGDPSLATVKGGYAQVLFQAAGEKVTPEVEKIMKEALTLDPLEPSALILKGIQAFTKGDLKNALVHWKKAKTKANESLLTSFLEPIITQTQARLTASIIKNNSETDNVARIEIKLTLDAKLKAKTKPENIIFIFAQRSGEKMPLAAHRLQVKDLPTTIVLDDTKSPMPTAKLSSADFVDITARVSFSGHPKMEKGDFFMNVKKIEVTEKTALKMEINQIVE